MHGVRDARAVAKPVETWAAHLTDDVHHEDRTRRSLGDRLERDGRSLGLARRARVREPLTEQRERDERQAHAHERGRARDGDRHAPIVAAAWLRVVHDFATIRRQSADRRRLRYEVDELARDDDRPRDLVAVELRLDALRLARQCDELVVADGR